MLRELEKPNAQLKKILYENYHKYLKLNNDEGIKFPLCHAAYREILENWVSVLENVSELFYKTSKDEYNSAYKAYERVADELDKLTFKHYTPV